jgi:hypothetical protein
MTIDLRLYSAVGPITDILTFPPKVQKVPDVAGHGNHRMRPPGEAASLAKIGGWARSVLIAQICR